MPDPCRVYSAGRVLNHEKIRDVCALLNLHDRVGVVQLSPHTQTLCSCLIDSETSKVRQILLELRFAQRSMQSDDGIEHVARWKVEPCLVSGKHH